VSQVRIPFVQLATQKKRELLPAIQREIEALFESSQFILGAKVAEFEKRFAELSGVPYAVGVNSGLDALILSLRVLGIGAGDEVITAPNSFLGSAAAIALVGARPVFVDVDWDYNLDPNRLEDAITSKTRAIMPVHLTGNPCRMEEINEIARRRKLFVIEDAAQAVGSTYKNKPVGGLGDLGAFSLHPLKNLHVWGDGGMITTHSKEWAESLRLHRNHGLKNRDESVFFSYNTRLDSIQAVVGLASLELLRETTALRQSNAQFYRKNLEGLDLKLPQACKEGEHVYHVFQIWTKRRDELKNFLAEKGIETKVHYPVPIHLQEAAKPYGFKKGDFPVTEQLAQGILSLPVRENLTAADREEITSTVKAFFR
jgi:dTDP-4-amino-4,6-dideoxygalactose transaminase